MVKIIAILLIGLLLETVGVLFLSKGLKRVGELQRVSAAEVVRVVKAGITNRDIMLGVLFEALFFATLLILMSRSDVSFVWPLTSLGFVLTTLAAKFILQEQVTALRWCGVILIMAGAGLITWTEQNKSNFDGKPAAPVRQTLP